jgi:hypothetical protein
MAARRLLVVLLAALVVASVAATLIAPPRSTGPPEGETSTTTPHNPDDKGQSGRLIEKSVQTPSKRPAAIELSVGDQLELTVRAGTPVQVEIPQLGMLEDADPEAPAHFSILATRPGRLSVRVVGGRPVAEVVVAEADGGRAPSGARRPAR